ncbi:MAG: HAMP domain-containing histidine kinase [Clostridiales bacterium]|nr:HAMP domain-containing histidine kinase [Clostridiales bacterium]
MYFAYPDFEKDYGGLLVVLVVFVYTFEVIALVLITHYFVYLRVDGYAKQLINMTSEGQETVVEKKTIDNITDNLASAVASTEAEYARLDQVRKAFVANASHELRSPLTSIQGFLQAVLDGTVKEEERDKYLNIALGETKRLNALITSMLDLSRLDNGKNPLVYTSFDINSVINDVVAKFEPSLIKKSLQINVNFFDESCRVYADKDKIMQVLINLIDNAIKYSPAYSRIIISTDLHENKVYVTVKDFGYGISKKEQALIWDTFYMTDKARSPVKTKGSGLGLSIVKKIIDEHGEIIWVESSRGAGATFIFTLAQFDAAKHGAHAGKVIKTETATEI